MSHKRQKATSFNNLSCLWEKRAWHREAQRFRSLEIDDEIELGRQQHRQVGWLLALENSADIDADLAKRTREVTSIAD